MRTAPASRRRSRPAIAALGGLLCWLVGAPPAPAATFVVDRTDDPFPSLDCLPEVANDCSLRQAVISANATAGDPHTITIPAGSYVLTRSGDGEDAASTGDLDVLRSLVVEGAGIDATEIDAGGVAGLGDRVFDVRSVSGGALVLRDLEITGGYLTTENGGGAIRSTGVLTLERVRLFDNHTDDNGGGILSQGDLTLIDCEIVQNDAVLGGGLISVATPNATLTVSGTELRDNSAINSGGGAYVSHGVAALSALAGSNGSVSITDSRFVGNDAGWAGGLRLINQNAPTATVTRTLFQGNEASGAGSDSNGGGVFVSLESRLDLLDSSFHWNTASFWGGGLYADADSAVEAEGTTFWRNSAATGGGAYCDVCGEIAFYNSTLNCNDSGGLGGAAAAQGGGLIFDRTTVSGNTATGGDGTIVASTSGFVGFVQSVLEGTCFSAGATFETGGGSLESPGDTCGLDSSDTRNVSDPLLSQAGDFGGETWTVLPLPGSPAIGASAGLGCTGTDQRGEPRPVGDCDAGSVERQTDDSDPIFLSHFGKTDLSDWSQSVF